MSLASKVRAFEKRIADTRALVRIEDAVRVLTLRDEVVDTITTHFGEAMTPRHRVVVTQRVPADTDDTLTARHDLKVRAAASARPLRPPNASDKATPA